MKETPGWQRLPEEESFCTWGFEANDLREVIDEQPFGVVPTGSIDDEVVRRRIQVLNE